MKLLQEYFKMKGGILQGVDGNGRKVIYIDPEVSENTYNLRNDIKTKFRASWIKSLGSWGWVVSTDPQKLIDTYVKPCLVYLTQHETNSEDGETRDFDAECKSIIEALEKAIETTKSTPSVDEETQQRLESFRKRLEDIFSGDGINENIVEFITNFIKFRNELKKRDTYEYTNVFNIMSIYINVQMKGKSTEVRPKNQWLKMGYEINNDAEGCPMIGKRYQTKRFTKKEKEEYIKWYLEKKGVATVEELPPSSQYDLFERRLKRGKKVSDKYNEYNFLVYSKSDVTAKNENAEVAPEEPSDNWWWDKVPADKKDMKLVEALSNFVQSEECGGITVNLMASQKELDGARGNASNMGHINIVNDGNIRFPTFVHEVTHELRHFKFVSTKNPQLKKYYGNLVSQDTMEQEADLCAAFVTEKYGYDIKSRINYVYNWGLNVNNFSAVLDQIAEVADFIDKGIQKYLNNNDEEETVEI